MTEKKQPSKKSGKKQEEKRAPVHGSWPDPQSREEISQPRPKLMPASTRKTRTGRRSGRRWRSSPSPAVWPSEFPQIEYPFDLIEGQPFVPDGTFHVGIPVELVSRALVFESEEEP